MTGRNFSLARRTAAFCLLSVAGFALSLTVAQAAPPPLTCCKCVLKDPTSITCVQINDTNCAQAMNSAATASGKIEFKCDATPIPEAQCKTIAEGGICATVGNPAQAAASAAPKEPFLATTPKLNIEIPGLVFAEGIKEEGGTASLPYIGQYISAFYRFAAGAGIIAAAVMIVYGGLLYILGGTIQSVKNGKEKIQDALIGLILFLTAYALLYVVNPAAVQLQPLNIRIAKYDDSFIINMMGDSTTYTPDATEVQQRIRQGVASAGAGAGSAPAEGQQSANQGTASAGAGAGSAPAEGQQSANQGTASAGAGPAQSVNLGNITLPFDPYKVEDGWAIDEDGTKLWPTGCDGIKMTGKGNAPGSFATVSKAFVGKPHTLDGLKAAILEAKKASQIGTFYARGIENLEPYPFIDPPSDDEIQNSKAFSGYLYKKIQPSIRKKKKNSEVHLEWVMMTITQNRKWNTSKVKKYCGNLTSLPKPFLNNLYQKFSRTPESRANLAPCINSIIEVYNNTYYKVAKCFNIFTNQCSFETYFQINFGKKTKPTVNQVPKDEVISNLQANKYQPGSGFYKGNMGHQWLYTGGLGLKFEVLEFGGISGNAPPVVITPGLMGEEKTTFKNGLGTFPSMLRYIDLIRSETFNINEVTW